MRSAAMAHLLTWAGRPRGCGRSRQRFWRATSQWTCFLLARRDPLLTRGRVVILVTMTETRSLAEAKAHLSELVARAGNEHERFTVTVHGRPAAVLLAVDDLEALEETIAVLSDANIVRALDQAVGELARGEGEDQESLAAAMAARLSWSSPSPRASSPTAWSSARTMFASLSTAIVSSRASRSSTARRTAAGRP